jgi:hypothetical protein
VRLFRRLRHVGDDPGQPVAPWIVVGLGNPGADYERTRHNVGAMVLEEGALRYRVGDSEAMAGQLGHLLSVMSLPNVSIGVIPFSAPRSMWPLEACHIYDDALVRVELLTAELTIKAPTEVTTYLKAFSHLQKLAVHGARARALITSAIDALE